MSARRGLKALAAAAALSLVVAAPAIADTLEPDESPTTSIAASGEEGGDGEADDESADNADESGESPDGESGTPDGGGDGGNALDDDGSGGDEDAAGEESSGESVEGGIGTLALPAEPTTIRIANITDFHGRIAASSGDDIVNTGPAVRLACYVEDNPEAILTSSGDNIGATPFISSAQNDYPTIDVLNAVGLKVSAFGNHELDKGWRDYLEKSAVMEWNDLAANMTARGDFETVYGEPYPVEPYEIHTVDGIDIAFIGGLTEEMPSLVTPTHLDVVDLTDIAEAVNTTAATLRAEESADVIVALIHEDMAMIAPQLQGVDLAFGGHSHVMFDNGSPEPLLAMQSIQYGEAISQVDMTVNPDGSLEFESVVLGLQPAQGSPLSSYRNDCTGAVSADVRQIVGSAADEAEEIGSRVLGYISGDFNRAVGLNPGTGASEENRGEESTVGNLVADAQLWAVQQTPQNADTELAFMNPGGLRTDLLYNSEVDGAVTLGEAAAMQPFANSLFTLTLTGQDVVNVLNEQLQPSGSSRPYLKLGVSGLTYEYDPETFAITEVWLDSGETFSLDGEYRVVVNAFLQAGGDNFVSFRNGTSVTDTGIVDLDAFVDFMGANAQQSAPLDPDGTVYGAQRSWGFADVSETDTDAVETGQEIAFSLAGLWFTTNETTNIENISVSLDGEMLGTFPVTGSDDDLRAKTTNYGRADARFALPDLSDRGGEEITLTINAGDQTLSEVTYPVKIPGTAPALDDLDPELEGAITVPSEAWPGDEIVVNIPGVEPGSQVGVWLFSDPVYLGTHIVSAQNTVTVTIPSDTEPGTHTIAVYLAPAELVGWDTIEILGTGTPTDPPTETPDETDDPGTGTPGEGIGTPTGADGTPLIVGALLLAIGGLALAARRRRALRLDE